MSLALLSKANPLIVGVDIGGTKTHVRALRDGDEFPKDLIVPTSSWRKRDWDLDAAGLIDLVQGFIGTKAIAALGIGAHGCDDAEECEAFHCAIAPRLPHPVAVVNDAELMPLAMGLVGQIGVVAGTGSIAVCRPSPDKMLVAGGWGWIISDEGSASSLVKEAVRAVARHLDLGGAEDEPLTKAMLEALDVKSIPRLGSMLNELRTAEHVGRHAPTLFLAAENGSAMAAQVIRDGGLLLAQLPAALQVRGAGATHVVAGGTVIASQALLWEAFVAGLAQTAPELVAHRFSGSPVEGACYLARTLLD